MTATKKPKPGTKDTKNNSTLWWILGGIVGLGLIVALAISIAGEEPVDESLGYGDPTVTGDPLPVYAAGQEDVSVGLTAPTVEGADWEGNPVTIEPDGTPEDHRLPRPLVPSLPGRGARHPDSGSTMAICPTTSS